MKPSPENGFHYHILVFTLILIPKKRIPVDESIDSDIGNRAKKTQNGLGTYQYQTVMALTFLLSKNCRAVLALLRKCGRLKFLPLSTCNLSPDKTSNKANNLVPSFKSSIRSVTRSGGLR